MLNRHEYAKVFSGNNAIHGILEKLNRKGIEMKRKGGVKKFLSTTMKLAHQHEKQLYPIEARLH